MSLRKSLLIKNILPAVILAVVGILDQRPVAHSIYPVLPAFIIIAVCFILLVWIYKKPTERFDEMAKRSYSQAGGLSYTVCLVAVACLVIYSIFRVDHTISVSNAALCFILAGMMIINAAAFMFYDIRGDKLKS